jgi:isopropylmalate/homocitrate/citramalate synthase
MNKIIKVMNQEKQYIKEMLQYADELGMGIEVRDDAKKFMDEGCDELSSYVTAFEEWCK